VVQETHRDQTNGAGTLEESIIQQVWGARYIDDAVARMRVTGNGSGGVAAGAAQELAFQLTDAQFSVIAVATPGKPGVVIDRIAYSPYGEATRTLRSDVNGDGFVNQSDYSGVIKPRIGATIGTANYIVEADLDRNGVINQLDYDISIADDGKSSSGGVGEAGLFSKGVRNSVGYCGYIFNEDSGLYTVRFRTYSPTLGRWLERDPAGYVDGMGLYEYVRGGATSAVDPSGRWTLPTSVMSRTISTVMQWGCGVRIARQRFGKRDDEKYWGHEWLEWRVRRSSPGGGTVEELEAIGYWPLMHRTREGRIVEEPEPGSSPLPAGKFGGSTLFGPPVDGLNPASGGFVPESCGVSDIASRSGDDEWQANRAINRAGERLLPTGAMKPMLGRTRAVMLPDGQLRWVHVVDETEEKLYAGAGRGTSCLTATCSQIIDCLRHVRPAVEYDTACYNCRDFVADALRQCCLEKGRKLR
jgi:RHS repeat-associated protein